MYILILGCCVITLSQVFEASLSDGQNVRSLGLKSLAEPVGISVDWIGSNVYVVDKTGRRIDVVSIDTGHQRGVVTDGLINPSSVVVDPASG